jgi:hypothetical protein
VRVFAWSAALVLLTPIYFLASWLLLVILIGGLGIHSLDWAVDRPWPALPIALLLEVATVLLTKKLFLNILRNAR